MSPNSTTRSSSGPQPQPVHTGAETPTSSAMVLSTSVSAGTANSILSNFKEHLALLYDKLNRLDTFATSCLEGPLPDRGTAAGLMTEHTDLKSAAPDLSTFHSLQKTAFDQLIALSREARAELAEEEVDDAGDPFFERKKAVEAKLSKVWDTLTDIVLERAKGTW